MPNPTAQPTMADLLALIQKQGEQIAALTAERDAGEAVVIEDAPAYTKKAWEEEIFVEAVRDLTYPDVNDTYAKYRYAGKDGGPGDVFRIAHREHLNASMRELKKGEEIPKRQQPAVPQTGARGVRVTVGQH